MTRGASTAGQRAATGGDGGAAALRRPRGHRLPRRRRLQPRRRRRRLRGQPRARRSSCSARRAAGSRRCSRPSPGSSSPPPAPIAVHGRADLEPGPRPRRRLPGVRPAVPVADRRRQRGLPAARSTARSKEEAAGARRRLPGDDAARARRRPLPAPALGRHEAARGDRPGARAGAADAADGRAVRVAGRADPLAAAARAQRDRRAHRRHGAVRHALASRRRWSLGHRIVVLGQPAVAGRGDRRRPQASTWTSEEFIRVPPPPARAAGRATSEEVDHAVFE